MRFGVPESWLRAVMRVESAGRVCAVSHKGAMGLMQVMPGTYAELRRRYGFGPDPYDVRDNILAGAAYLREMYDRFGAPGFLAAYNAGPGRYREHLAGRPLPLETRAYVARLAPSVAAPTVPGVIVVAPQPPSPPPLDTRLAALRAPIFVQNNDPHSGGRAASFEPSTSEQAQPSEREDAAAGPLFTVRTPAESGQ